MDTELSVPVMMAHTMQHYAHLTRSSNFLPNEQNTSTKHLLTNSSKRNLFFNECSQRLKNLKKLGVTTTTLQIQTTFGRNYYHVTIMCAGPQTFHFYGRTYGAAYQEALKFMATENSDDIMANMTN